uniref:Gluconate 2-dehydrogenase subunit 3 family protein n=1 Tax=Eiseniibacteriota bacterium TaxID=2212470 RepID=A0A832MJD4_UNCEI
MSATRRKFLACVGLAALAAGVTAAWRRRRAVSDWLLAKSLPPAPPGPLALTTEETLVAAVTGLLDARVETGHHLEAFRWRARHVAGARALYERFERAMDEAARRAGHAAFRAAPPAVRRRLLARLAAPRGWAGRARRAFLAREDARFARFIVRDIFRRFARTDAFVLAGYDAWPGMPRALARLEPHGPRS